LVLFTTKHAKYTKIWDILNELHDNFRIFRVFRGNDIDMIARRWKCICPPRQRDGFLAHLNETGMKDISTTPGFLGGQILERPLGDALEITLISYWDSAEAIRKFAGDNIEVARLYPDDERYDIVADQHVTHYTIINQYRIAFGKEKL